MITTAIEIENAKLEAVQDNAKDGDHISQEGAGRKHDSNGTRAIGDNSALAAARLIDAVLDEESNRPEYEVFTARDEPQQLVDAWKTFKVSPRCGPQHQLSFIL